MFEEVTINLHYSRGGRRVSSRWALLAAVGLLTAVPVLGQYPGQITKKDKDTPALRAVGVLEWTGEAGKPKTSRLIPITVFDGEQLQDGGIYLARPEPLAVQGGVEYILQKDGGKIGLFDVQSAGQEQGSWVGFGTWKAMPSPKPPAMATTAQVDDDEASDRPTLHRKRDSSSSGSDSGGQGAPDPDRPTLHKKTSSTDDSSSSSSGSTNSTGTTSGTANSGSTTSSSTTSTTNSTTTSSGSAPTDPDRPALKRGKAKQETDTGYVESLASATDPNRPHLQRGKSNGGVGSEVTPTLMGLPADMEQTVAVSDPRNKPEHPWRYSWADPADEQKMKADLEDIARTALGLNAPPPKPKTATATARTKHSITSPPVPPPLAGEQFRVFELAYGSGATLVLTAHTDGPPEKQKFVTLIAQPDLYGSLLVLFKSVTDAAHLDDTPRMRLIDAVDAMADNRGELLFELRGSTQRQFALYRVMRGTAEKLFVTSGGVFGSQAMN